VQFEADLAIGAQQQDPHAGRPGAATAAAS
jgi:hypothetical protein